jgi:hypothetical protein
VHMGIIINNIIMLVLVGNRMGVYTIGGLG